MRAEPLEPATDSHSRRRANQYSPPTHQYVGAGRLRLVCLEPTDYEDPRRSWGDRGRTGLEQKLPEILWHFQKLAGATRRKRAVAAEVKRLRQEQERRELELSISRGHHAKLVETLEVSARSTPTYRRRPAGEQTRRRKGRLSAVGRAVRQSTGSVPPRATKTRNVTGQRLELPIRY